MQKQEPNQQSTIENQKSPTRTFLGCRRKGDQGSFLRVSRADGGRVVLCDGRKHSGRTAYICPGIECIDAALSKGRLDRALKAPVAAEARAALREELVCKLR